MTVMQSPDQATYLAVTPAGAFFAVAAPSPDAVRKFIWRLLALPSTPNANELNSCLDDELARTTPDLIERLIGLGWLRYLATQDSARLISPELLFPQLLTQLSDRGRALLADHQGLQIANGGFSDADAAGLAALSADANALAQRCAMLLPEMGSNLARAWATVDAAGNSQIGVWPIHLPDRQFALVIEGRPLFIRDAFQQLVWCLMRRYGI